MPFAILNKVCFLKGWLTQWPGNQTTNAGIKHIVFVHVLFTFYSVLSAVNGFVEIIVSYIQIGFNFRNKLPIKAIH